MPKPTVLQIILSKAVDFMPITALVLTVLLTFISIIIILKKKREKEMYLGTIVKWIIGVGLLNWFYWDLTLLC